MQEYKMLTIKIEEEIHRDMKTLASSKGMKLKELVKELFQEKLEKEGVR